MGPLASTGALKEAMVGAGLALAEASKRSEAEPFKDWNVAQIVKMGKAWEDQSKSEKCFGSTHVTKAYVINENSLKMMLQQQKIQFCERGVAKEMNPYDHVFRTSFAEAYMLWRAQRACRGKGKDACLASTSLRSMCGSVWTDSHAAQRDIEKHLFAHDRVSSDYWWRGDSKWSKNNTTMHLDCSPGLLIELLCRPPMEQVYKSRPQLFDKIERFYHSDAGVFDVDGAILSEPEFGFGFFRGLYYGPGGMTKGDTTTKIGTMVSADGSILYGLAEHRKDTFNVAYFRNCLYKYLMPIFRSTRTSNEEKTAKAFKLFDDAEHKCSKALSGAAELHEFSVAPTRT